MSPKFDGASAELQPNKNTEDINNKKKINKKNKHIENELEKKSNPEQISEKEERRKNKSWADCPLTDHPNRRSRMDCYGKQTARGRTYRNSL